MSIASHFPEQARARIRATGTDVLRTLGIGRVQEVVTQVLLGGNIRTTTEPLTQERLGILTEGIIVLYMALAAQGVSWERVLERAAQELLSPNTPGSEKDILRWVLGLTIKSGQNVLREDPEALNRYVGVLRDGIRGAAQLAERQSGKVRLSLGTDPTSALDWPWTLLVMKTVGAMTLSARGSDKSLYGKFFERLTLASLLSLLGYTYTDKEDPSRREFTLSARRNKREADATCVWGRKGVFFDIGFIGKGNPEITLDKLTRFGSNLALHGQTLDMATFIVVDSAPLATTIETIADEHGVKVFQMSKATWVLEVAQAMHEVLDGFPQPLPEWSDPQLYAKAIASGVRGAPLRQIAGGVPSD